MKVGIYISGLGQSFVDESVEKYAERLMNEISFNTSGIDYEIKKEKVNYTKDRYSNVISICEKNEQGNIIYKFYDFRYHEILTEKFNSYSLIIKNLRLFFLVFTKFPLIISRLFKSKSYKRPGQTFYLFIIFMLIACAVLLMLPATIGLIANLAESSIIGDTLATIQKTFPFLTDISFISKAGIKDFSKGLISLTALLVLFLPKANTLIPNLATEFVCANDYIQHGTQRQLLQGNLDLLINYITEKETDCKIHIHAYSFGSILAIDYIHPFGNKVSKDADFFCEALITIGTPFEFIKSYYPQFYNDRNTELGNKICWINVYSIADALGTNFRNDLTIGNAQFGISNDSSKPTNINYEVVSAHKSGIIDFFTLYNVKVHGMYWDAKTEGQSCLRLVYEEMISQKLILLPQ